MCNDERKRKKCWYSSGTCNIQVEKESKERTRLTNKHKKNKEKKICFTNLLFSVSGDM
jgi:hypothetical protein